MEKIFTYLAAPYTDKDPTVVDARVEAVMRADAWLTKYQHKLIVTPLSKHFILKYEKISNTWGYWEKYGKGLLDLSKELIVLRLPGWENSTGVADEMSYASQIDIPIVYLDLWMMEKPSNNEWCLAP